METQLEYMAAIAFAVSRLGLTDLSKGESKTLRQQQKQQVVTQAERVWQWASSKGASPPPPPLKQQSSGSSGSAPTPPKRLSSPTGASLALNK